jgi:hypothetical protein
MGMHVAIAILTIMASFKWGNWKSWREYHASMFFIATGGLLYEYIVKDYSLWKFHPDLLYGVPSGKFGFTTIKKVSNIKKAIP